jgi:hypothetical protein
MREMEIVIWRSTVQLNGNNFEDMDRIPEDMDRLPEVGDPT